MNRKRTKKNNTLLNVLLIGLILVVTYFGGGDLIKDKNAKSAKEEDKTQVDTKRNVLKGIVTHVSDGDTVILKDSEGNTYKVRLNGIDAPEMGQSYGKESRDFLKSLVLNKQAEVEKVGVDQYQRMLGVLLVDGKDINKTMLEKGMAWQYKYNKDQSYTDLEKKARNQKINIWSDPNAQNPHAWRKDNK